MAKRNLRVAQGRPQGGLKVRPGGASQPKADLKTRTILSSASSKERPWDAYQGERGWRVLKPGWGGSLEDDEVEYIQRKLQADDSLSFAWGFRPGQKTRSEAAIRRIAMSGDPDVRGTNVKLARTRKVEIPAKSGREAA
jgi:hypothetical protein